MTTQTDRTAAGDEVEETLAQLDAVAQKLFSSDPNDEPDEESLEGSAAAIIRALLADRDALARRVEAMRDVLVGIKSQGELACVSAEQPFSAPSGKKPATKEVWQFPRWMLDDLDAALTGDPNA